MHLSEIWHSKKNDCCLSRTQVIISIPRVEALRTSTLGYEIATPAELLLLAGIIHR